MSQQVARRSPGSVRWPMTSLAWQSLVDEVGHLRERLRVLGGPPSEDGVQLPWVAARSRYDTLSAVLDDAVRIDAPAGAVIGRRVTLLEEDGLSVVYLLVCPGEGDAARGWIAADSPLGQAVVGAVAGDSIRVHAPAGPRVATVLSVD